MFEVNDLDINAEMFNDFLRFNFSMSQEKKLQFIDMMRSMTDIRFNKNIKRTIYFFGIHEINTFPIETSWMEREKLKRAINEIGANLWILIM